MLCSFIGIHLAFLVRRRRLTVHPPVVKHLRDMDNLRRLRMLHTSQDKIKILRTIVFCSQTADLVEKCLFDNQKMADVVIRTDHLRVKVRLEMRIGILFSRLVDLVFIRVDQFRLRIAYYRTHRLVKHIRRQKIIVIKESDIIAVSKLHARIRIL